MDWEIVSCLCSSTMAATVQDVFMLFGDSITQGAWEPGFTGLGQQLSRESTQISMGV